MGDGCTDRLPDPEPFELAGPGLPLFLYSTLKEPDCWDSFPYDDGVSREFCSSFTRFCPPGRRLRSFLAGSWLCEGIDDDDSLSLSLLFLRLRSFCSAGIICCWSCGLSESRVALPP